MDTIITLVILIFSAIVHEVMHGIAAEKLGDPTAREEGRITLNPIPHIDPFGTILLPLIMYISQAPLLIAGYISQPFILGAAKPVPVNFNNLRYKRLGMALVSLAGPISNFLLAVLFILPVKFALVSGPMAKYWLGAAFINVLLGTFNLLPIPPLDGSKVIASILPSQLMYRLLELERYGFVIVIILLVLGLLDKVLLPAAQLFFGIFGIQS